MTSRPPPIVRAAEPDDLPALMRMARAFYAASPCIHYIPFCPESMAETMTRLATDPGACLLVGEVDGETVAMIAGVSVTHYVNANHLTAQELFWWCDPSARGSGVALKLLAALEEWARKIESRTMFISSTANLEPDKLARFYRRKGFDAVDLSYAKSLEN